jgi:hypothetical protein
MKTILHKYSVKYTTVCRRIPICIQSEALVACHVAYEMNKIAIFVTQEVEDMCLGSGSKSMGPDLYAVHFF